LTNIPAPPAGIDRVPGEYRRVRLFLVACAFAAMIVGTVGQIVMPARGSPFLAWLDTAVIPAFVTVLFVLLRPDRPVLLALTLGLVYLEAVLTASLFAIGLAFSIVVPIIGIGLVGPRVRGRALVATYVGAWAVATISVIVAETGNPPNPLGSDVPALTATAFALITAGALGLMWRSSDQQVRALEAADREITARIAAKAELERTAEFLETLVGASPVATIALNQSGIVILWNPAAVRVFGWTEIETVGRVLPAALTADGPRDGIGLGGLIARSLAGTAIRGDRVVTRRRDGTEVIVEVHADARQVAAGRATGIIVQAIDVTERSALEARLRESQKLEAVGHLAGGIAHDINNALTAVGGFTEMIEADAEDPVVKADARAVVEGVQRASQLTRQLLAFAQRSVLKPQVIDAASFLESIRPELQRLLRPDVALVIRTVAKPAFVDVDPGQFEQAVRSLVENAVDAMPAGGRLTISTVRREAPDEPNDPTMGARSTALHGPVIVVTVTDTGGGIEPALQEQAFEPYVIADEGGSVGGLGLAMVHGFVAQSGGEVELRSRQGAGTTVEIHLPAAAQPEGPDRSDGRPGSDGAATLRPAGGDETILLIEDEPAIAEFCRRVLTNLGYDVIVAVDGPAGVEAARTHPDPIGLVLSDVIMPGMRGPEAVATIRASHPEVAVLFASGYTADSITEHGVLRDGVKLIEKPFTAASLADSVRQSLDARADTAAAAKLA
jgi:PAS domain S-box-containing protein